MQPRQEPLMRNSGELRRAEAMELNELDDLLDDNFSDSVSNSSSGESFDF